ncbi:hypothetical protein PPL_10081 [Heterostelium album PN500]|uniref:Right handed beta helix domain-containing protein n=1 Tax=Heterostelium pallidum (strain ATCC 26659 / Pp 5 / PN500) TaxID=670386 RepID=D3BQ98_HETP5|nr:hypothetical protein PPL_10081 [Heterostelium album PN500]EFA76318.1 hypothetical protein PPL_10081 [Heterostelium album PN500]|eukprot:XP_020428450.1 hypothetical protein PPL_10081 [Heterostelium album PN500]
MPCGDTTQNACLDILTALSVYKNSNNSDSLVLLLAGGVYSGPNNTDISLSNITLTIKSANPNSQATIDMKSEAGFIIIADTPVPTTTMLTISYMTVTNSLGAAVTINISNVYTNVVMDNVIATNNNNNNGGVFNVQTSGHSSATTSVVISNSVLNNNTATNSGAVYYTSTPGNLTIVNSVINNNIAGKTGILYIIFSGLYLNNVTMSGNIASSTLMAIANVADTATINGLTYANNNLRNSGGSHIKSIESDVLITSSTFSGNNGGSIIQYKLSSLFYGRLLNINNCKFNQNIGSSVGVLYMDSGAVLNLNNSVFTNNFANDYGGALYLSGSYSAKVSNTLFNNTNVGDDGVGSTVYSSGVSSGLIFTNVTFNTTSNVTTPFYCSMSKLTFNNIKTNAKTFLSCASEDSCTVSGTSDAYSCKDEPADSNDHKKKGLTNGQVAGIVIGVILGIAFVIIIVYIAYKRHHNHHKYRSYH